MTELISQKKYKEALSWLSANPEPPRHELKSKLERLVAKNAGRDPETASLFKGGGHATRESKLNDAKRRNVKAILPFADREYTIEFGDGERRLATLEGIGKFVFETPPGRNVIAFPFCVSKEMSYRVSGRARLLSNHPGAAIAIIGQGIKGQTEWVPGRKSDHQEFEISFASDTDQEVKIRIGTGTTNKVNHDTAIEFADLKLVESIRLPDNRSIVRRDLHGYIDPALVLPTVTGISNDYGHLAEKLHQKNWDVEFSKKLSIIIPFFDRLNLLDCCLAAVSIQAYPKELLEVVLVDDGSHHGIENLFNKYEKTLNIYWARQPRAGFGLARARNLGARVSSGEVLFFLDSDILIPAGFLRELMSYHHVADNVSTFALRRFVSAKEFSSNDILSNAGILENPVYVDSGNPLHTSKSRSDGKTVEARSKVLENTRGLRDCEDPFLYISGGHLSVSRRRFFEVGGVDETFDGWGNEDREFSYRLWATGQYFIPLSQNDLHLEEDASMQYTKVEDNVRTLSRFKELVAWPLNRSAVVSGTYDVPFFSIYVPAYNAEDYIEEAIESVLSQDFSDYEIIVVDDGSIDGTWSIIEAKFLSNPRIKAFKKENSGIGATSNYAVRKCRGAYIVQLDSDDRLMPNSLSKLFGYLRDHPDWDVVFSKYELIDKQGHLIGPGWSADSFDEYQNLVGMCVGHLRCFKRWVYFRTEGFDETIENAVDYDFYLKVSRVARIRHIPAVLYRYRIHQKQTSTARRAQQIQNHALVLNKHLQRIGLSEFRADRLNPLEPQRNFVYAFGSEFHDALISKFESGTHRQATPPRPIPLGEPSCPGNDYTAISNFVRDFYQDQVPTYTKRVSIVVPVYNRSERLSRCLAGICKQTYPADLIEVVVVDDGSSDDVLRVIRKYESRLDLRYVKQDDRGYRLSAARNIGIRSARYEYISIIDCDLIPLPFFIESFMQYLHHYNNVVLLGHQKFVDPTGISDDDILADPSVLSKMPEIKSENSTMSVGESGITRDWRYDLYETTNYLKDDPFPYRAFSSGHVAYHRSVIEAADYYDEDFTVWGCEDNEAGYRIYLKGYYFIPVLDAVDLHQEPPSGKNETNREEHRKISRKMLQERCPPTRTWFGERFIPAPEHMPHVSICIPYYNVPQFIGQAVRSAINQTYRDIEILIYDDGSIDQISLNEIETLINGDGRIRFVRSEQHHGVTFSRNWLIENARGEYIGFLDADDLLVESAIAECMHVFNNHSRVGLVSTNYERIDEMGAHISAGYKPPSISRQSMLYGNIFTHFRMFRVRDWCRSVKWTTREMNELWYGEDWDLCLKLTEVADFMYIDKSLYKYRVRPKSITTGSDRESLASQARLIAENLLRRRKVDGLSVVSLDVNNNPHTIGYI
ncbi:MAG: glycosyltransferase [Candidatus Nanopelagicaceae bacterium]